MQLSLRWEAEKCVSSARNTQFGSPINLQSLGIVIIQMYSYLSNERTTRDGFEVLPNF